MSMTVFYKANKAIEKAVKEREVEGKKVMRKLRKAMRDHGADDVYADHWSLAFSYFIFKEKPDSKIWKKKGKGYTPKLNSNEGKKLHMKLKKINESIYPLNKNLLKVCGFEKGPFFTGTHIIRRPQLLRCKDDSTLVGYNPNVLEHKGFVLPKGLKELKYSETKKLTEKKK